MKMANNNFNDTELRSKQGSEQSTEEKSFGVLRLFVFCLSLMVMTLITIWPHFLGVTPEQMNHNAAMILMLGMSFGFVYGIGYIPKTRWLQWVFSAPISIALMTIGIMMSN
jgi:predicted membrane protein